MTQIASTRGTNGYTVVSTFSGGGGSCLGFEMAGYRILWANEFIPAAQKVYRANHSGVRLDTRDIRTIQPDEILKAIRRRRGEIDVLEGSPPCASFSTAGKREKGWGKVKKYSDTAQRVDDLFFEFARLLVELQPRVFVAENVSGLVKGAAKGYFKQILAALKDCGYRVQAKLLDAQWLGVPQMRQRIIFIGVRADLNLAPVFPKPLPYRYSVRDALPWIAEVGYSKINERRFITDFRADKPAPTIPASKEGGSYPNYFVNARAVEDTGGQWGKGEFTDEPAPTVRASGVGHLYIEQETDISRYAIGDEWEKLKPGEQSAKYFNLVKPALDGPCPTVLATSGGYPSAAQALHPTEKRKFSIAELKGICGFPDDFVLTGTYAQQWERLGRAVPPVMMYHIARAIKEGILDQCAA